MNERYTLTVFVDGVANPQIVEFVGHPSLDEIGSVYVWSTREKSFGIAGHELVYFKLERSNA